MKKGQTHQVFIYVMVVLVVGAVLLFGYKAIDNILNKTCQVDETTFVSNIDRILNSITKGDVKNEPVKVPCSYEEICFVGIVNDTSVETFMEENYPIIYSEYEAGTGNNVFLIKNSLTKPIIAFEGLSANSQTTPGFLCVQNKGGNFNLIFQGIGGGNVIVSES